MRAVTLARRLLAFPLMSVKRVRFEPKPLGGQVFVIEVAVRGCSRCSRCGRKCPRYDRLAPRRWRDLDFGAHEVAIEATLARVDCKVSVRRAERRNGRTLDATPTKHQAG